MTLATIYCPIIGSAHLNLNTGFFGSGCCWICCASCAGDGVTAFACGTAGVCSLDDRYRTAVMDFIGPSSGMVWIFPSEKLITTESAQPIALHERMRTTGRRIFKTFIGVFSFVIMMWCFYDPLVDIFKFYIMKLLPPINQNTSGTHIKLFFPQLMQLRTVTHPSEVSKDEQHRSVMLELKFF